MINTTVRHNLWCKFRKHSLVLCWCFGLLFGVLTARAAEDDLVPMVRGALSCPVSIPGLLASAVLPFLLSAYAVSFSEPWLLLPISALKAFGFGFCAFGVDLAFGSAGWLVRLLFLFTDVCITPILFFYWLRHIGGTPGKPFGDFVSCIAAATVIAATDYCLISPFLATLIEF